VAMTEQQSIWRNTNVPAPYRNTYDKAMAGRKPLAAIRAKCQDCMNWQNAEIKACNIPYCPLWPYRMGKRAPKIEGEAGKSQNRMNGEALARLKAGRGTCDAPEGRSFGFDVNQSSVLSAVGKLQAV